MTTTTLRFEKSPTLSQQKMAINVLMAMGMPVQVVKITHREPQEWIPTKEELARIDRAKQSAAEGNVVRLTPELRKELFG